MCLDVLTCSLFPLKTNQEVITGQTEVMGWDGMGWDGMGWDGMGGM